MNISFHIDYQTTFGEEIVLNLLPKDNAGAPTQHKLTTHDGAHWCCDLSMSAKPGTYIDYYYSLCRGDEELRHEWLVIPHRLEFAAQKASRYTVYEHWLDIPEDAYMYSSASPTACWPASAH